MKNYKINKLKQFCEYIIEKCMEWIVHLYNCLTIKKVWTSNLSEHYCIYKEYIGKEYIKNFLDERERIVNRNRYKMNIEIICEEGEPGIVGKVILYRKNKAIHQATLKVRNNNDNDGIVFWSFEERESQITVNQ